MTTSRPVFSRLDLQRDAERRPLSTSVCCVFGKADLPRTTRMLQRGQRRSTGAPVEAGNSDVIGACLGNAGRNGADTNFRYQLDRDIGFGVDVFRS